MENKKTGFKLSLPILLLLLFIPYSGCTVYKSAHYSSAEEVVTENPVKLKSIILKNNDTIVINRSVALVEVNKYLITIRYFSGDTLLVPSSDIRSVVVSHVNKPGTVAVNSISILGGLALSALLLYGIYYFIFVLLRGGY
ncbi:MAG: hypothetical protein IQL11_15680 [Bacteroidales bacterium]|nr:hypothetical protein [Bacteroidales bacterium]